MDSPVVEKTGGMAYEVILKQANKENSPVARQSPATPRSVSSASIEKKLIEAKERRTLMERCRQENWLKEKTKIEEANQRVQQCNDSFAKETEKKLQEKMEVSQEKKDAHMSALLARLQLHAKRVEEVRGLSDSYNAELKERVDRDFKEHLERGQAQMTALQERLSKHKKRVTEVLENSKDQSRQTREKMVAKMERTLRNKEEQMEKLMRRVREHNTKAVSRSRSSKIDESISAANISTLEI